MLCPTKQSNQGKEQACTSSPLSLPGLLSALDDVCKSKSSLGNEIAVDNEGYLSAGQQKCTFSLRQAWLHDGSVLECILWRQEGVVGVCLEGTGSFAHFLFYVKNGSALREAWVEVLLHCLNNVLGRAIAT